MGRDHSSEDLTLGMWLGAPSKKIIISFWGSFELFIEQKQRLSSQVMILPGSNPALNQDTFLQIPLHIVEHPWRSWESISWNALALPDISVH